MSRAFNDPANTPANASAHVPADTSAQGSNAYARAARPAQTARPEHSAHPAPSMPFPAASQQSAINHAPILPGYTPLRILGNGSTAAVILYHQNATNRDVAVKISLKPLNTEDFQRFTKEASIMGKVTHPYCLNVYDAGVTSDGRAYIVCEYAPGGSLKELLATKRLTAEECMSLGVNLASALYTAHHAGIVHRDIKTSNILITAQGNPALADFGISTSVYDHSSTGFSLPWAAPEVLRNNGQGTESSDIYALAATLYACLAGKSPFEYGYHPRTKQELANFIANLPAPPLNRPDVPQELEKVLAKAMSKNSEDRYFSALDFARALQEVEFATKGTATPVSVEKVPQYPTRTEQNRHTALPNVPASQQTRALPWRRITQTGIAAAVVVAACWAAFTFLILPKGDSAHTRNTTLAQGVTAQQEKDLAVPSTEEQNDPNASSSTAQAVPVPSVTDLKGTLNGGTARFTWANPEPEKGDRYAWSLISQDDPQGTTSRMTEARGITVPAQQDGPTCIQVSVIRADRSMSETPTTACVSQQ